MARILFVSRAQDAAVQCEEDGSREEDELCCERMSSYILY